MSRCMLPWSYGDLGGRKKVYEVYSPYSTNSCIQILHCPSSGLHRPPRFLGLRQQGTDRAWLKWRVRLQCPTTPNNKKLLFWYLSNIPHRLHTFRFQVMFLFTLSILLLQDKVMELLQIVSCDDECWLVNLTLTPTLGRRRAHGSQSVQKYGINFARLQIFVFSSSFLPQWLREWPTFISHNDFNSARSLTIANDLNRKITIFLRPSPLLFTTMMTHTSIKNGQLNFPC